jgi:hypothetical protein
LAADHQPQTAEPTPRHEATVGGVASQREKIRRLPCCAEAADSYLSAPLHGQTSTNKNIKLIRQSAFRT